MPVTPMSVTPEQRKIIEANKSNALVSLPVELLAKVASNLDKEDIMNFRLTNRMFSAVRASWFWDMLITSKTIYGRFASMAHFLGLLQEFSEYELGSRVECLSLVSEGLRFHEYGPEWAWERMALEDNINITSDDEAVIDKINYDHATEITTNGAFLTGGGFRSTLIGIIAACPNLKAINVRKLKPDEHIPGWTDTDAFKQLSFFRPGLNLKNIFYGDWQYDTVHLRVTKYADEFGDAVEEPGAGPQAGFKEDFAAAIATSVNNIEITYTN